VATFHTDMPAKGRVRAKFYVRAVELTTWGTNVTLQPVSRGEDNKAWSAATPTGEIRMGIKNELAAERFSPGQEWYVDFSPAPQGEEGMGAD
jgi:hypothetical protein